MNQANLSELGNLKRFHGLIRVIECIRRIHPNAGTNTVIAFITIAMNPSITVGNLQKSLGFLATSTARSLATMLETNRGKPGLGIITQTADHYDRRIRHLHLTPRGQKIWNEMQAAMAS